MDNDKEFIDPEEHQPDVQSGLSSVETDDLQIATDEHPLVKRVGHNSVISWNIPKEVLKHLSVSLYDSSERTVREFLANAETAVLRTDSGEPAYVEDNYQPIIEVTFREDERKIIIQDNGVGISSSTMLEVVRKIGVTTGRNDGELSGSFGMGMASFLKLTSVDGNMIIKTHSRDTDENYAVYAGIGGFQPLQGGLPADVYGTRFEMILQNDNISAQDVRNYVERNAKHQRVPVHYEEYDANATQQFDEDWGGEKLGDGAALAKVEEDGLYRAVMPYGEETKTLLLSMPIGRNDGSNGGKSWNATNPFSIRIMSEDGRVVAGPHKGLIPISDTEYDELSSEEQERYVRSNALTDDDICLPMPTSSRDTLQENEEFWKYVSEKVNDNFLQRISIADQADSKEEFLALGENGIEELLEEQKV